MKTVVLYYRTQSGRVPLLEWLAGLKDKRVAAAVIRRIDQLQGGHHGDHKKLSGSICELRMHLGSGYRIYYVRDGAAVVVLLCAGIKRSQPGDVEKAKRYWNDYQNRL